MTGELFINGKDAYTTWGISIDNTSLSALMAPPPMKEYISCSSRLEHGSRIDASNSKLDERELTLQINLTASDENMFFSRYLSFCDELAKGTLEIRTKYQPNVIYRTLYLSCSQFSQFMRGIGKFSLKLIEPNPKNRSLDA